MCDIGRLALCLEGRGRVEGGRQLRREGMSAHVTHSLCSVLHQKLTQHCRAVTLQLKSFEDAKS